MAVRGGDQAASPVPNRRESPACQMRRAKLDDSGLKRVKPKCS